MILSSPINFIRLGKTTTTMLRLNRILTARQSMKLHLMTPLLFVLASGPGCGTAPVSTPSKLHSAARVEGACDDTEVVTRPYFPEDSKSPTFQYRYKYIRREAATKTVVFLPGGPGDTSINLASNQYFLDLFFPNDVNIVLTDPRGTGCNDVVPSPIPDGFFSTNHISSDVLSIVEQRRLGDYIIFGWSYGTMVATVVASQAEAIGFAPYAVVLQSTIGKHFGDEFDVYSGFQREWDKVWSALSPPIKDLLSEAPLPFGLSSAQWGAYIVGKTMFPSRRTLSEELSVLEGGTQDQLDRLKTKVIEWATSIMSSDPNYERIYKSIACDEIASSDNTDIALINGDLIGHQTLGFCADRSMAHPFDSSSYQLSMPVFYLQGADDPATTVENAKYHFNNQTHGRNFLISVPLIGHRPVDRLADCYTDLWRSFENAGAMIDEAIANCSAGPSLQSK